MSVLVNRNLTCSQIVDAVSREFHVPPEEILKGRRTKARTMARHCAMYLIRMMTNLSLTEIGEFFGRHHSSVINGCSNTSLAIRFDPDFKARVDRIINDLLL